MTDAAALRRAKNLLLAEMDRQGTVDNELRAGTAAIAMGESGFDSRSEVPYRNTANDRIRRIFRSRLGDESDAFINNLKASDERFFNYVYGPQFNHIHNLGQVEPDDGWRFRGHGTVQLTGRANHKKLKELTGHDIVGNPDLANRPDVAAAITVAYMLWRYKRGGWNAMKAAVGISFGDVDRRKNAAFEHFKATGEFDLRPGATPDLRLPSESDSDDLRGENRRRRQPRETIERVQRVLYEDGYYPDGTAEEDEVDGTFGRRSKDALNAALAAAGQATIG